MAVAYNPRAINLGFLNYFSQKPNNPADTVQGQIDALKGANAAVAAAGENGGVQAGGQTASGGTQVNVADLTGLRGEPQAGDAYGNTTPSTGQTVANAAVNAVKGIQAGGQTANTGVLTTPTGTAAGQAGPMTRVPTMDTSGLAVGQAGTSAGQAGAPADKSDYEWNQDFADWMLEKPMTIEERARRERAAHSIAGIGALGNVLNAFSNLAFATQAAPSQKLPDVPDAGGMVQRERDYWDKTRDRYLTWKMQEKQLGLREKQIAQQAEQYRARLQYQAEKDKAELEFRQAVEEAKEQYQGKQLEQKVKELEERKRQFDKRMENERKKIGIMGMNAATNRGRLNLQRDIHSERVKSGGYGRGGGSSSQGILLSSPSGSYKVTPKLTSDVVSNLYAGFSADMRKEVADSHPGFNTYMTPKERESIIRDAIDARIAQDDSYAQKLVQLGYLEPYRTANSWDDYELDDEDDDDFSEFEVN